MSCRNPNSETSAENCETLEILGPKIKNARKFTLNIVGGALKEAIHFYIIFFPKFQVLSVGTPKRRGSYVFSGNPRRVVQFKKKGRLD
jgi:hypothetical protein